MSIKFPLDGRRQVLLVVVLAVCMATGAVLWLRTKHPKAHYSVRLTPAWSTKCSQPIASLAFSPKKAILAGAEAEGRVWLWDVPTRRVTATLPTQKGIVWSQAFSPDGTMLATASTVDVPCVWDMETSRPLLKLRGYGQAVGIAFSPNGKLLAVSHSKDKVTIWSMPKGKLVRELPGGGSFRLAFSRDGAILACGGKEDTLQLFDMPSGKLRSVLPRCTGDSVRFSPAGRILASPTSDRKVSCWDIGRDIVLLKKLDFRRMGSPNHVAFTPDGKFLVVAGRRSRAGGGKIMRLIPRSSSAPTSRIVSSIAVYEVATGRCVGELTIGPVFVLSLAVSSDGRFLAASDDRRLVRVWRMHIAPVKQFGHGTCDILEHQPGSPKESYLDFAERGDDAGLSGYHRLRHDPAWSAFRITNYDLTHIVLAFLGACYSAGGDRFPDRNHNVTYDVSQSESIANAFLEAGVRVVVGFRNKVRLQCGGNAFVFSWFFWNCLSRGETVKQAKEHALGSFWCYGNVPVRVLGDENTRIFPQRK